MESQTEISHDPEELWKIFLDFLRVTLSEGFRLYLEFLGKIDDQGKGVYGVFINCVHGIEDELTAKQKGKEEDLGVMVYVFIKGTDTLAVYYQDGHLLAGGGLSVNSFTPYPETFGAWVDGGSHSKALVPLV